MATLETDRLRRDLGDAAPDDGGEGDAAPVDGGDGAAPVDDGDGDARQSDDDHFGSDGSDYASSGDEGDQGAELTEAEKKARDKRVARAVKPVLKGLFAAGGGRVGDTEAILVSVAERFGDLTGCDDLKGLTAVRAMVESVAGYFDLAALPEGGTRTTYAQQKVDAVMEALTPPDAAAKQLLRGIARI